VVIGTVLGDTMLSALRRLAQENASAHAARLPATATASTHAWTGPAPATFDREEARTKAVPVGPAAVTPGLFLRKHWMRVLSGVRRRPAPVYG
jgi:hypothetical protein